MSKERFSVSMDEEHYAWLDANVDNKSQFINRLVGEYINGSGKKEDAIARYRLEQLRAEEQAVQARLDTVQEQLRSVESDVTTHAESKAEQFEFFVNNFDSVPSPDNAAVEARAEKCNMDPETFVEEYVDWLQDTRGEE